MRSAVGHKDVIEKSCVYSALTWHEKIVPIIIIKPFSLNYKVKQ